MKDRSNWVFSEEVEYALKNRLPVVALESTLITHGLPTPYNFKTAIAAENAIRESGAIPATIAILNGSIKIGLNLSELEQLASFGDVKKASLHNIGKIIANSENASTTVAATTFFAHKAQIAIFATGGLGGIHHGNSGDISADLTALATTPIAVICSGIKAILNMPRTVEVLETLGVPTIGYRTNAFSEFWSLGTELPISTRADKPIEIAKIIHTHWKTGLKTGVVVTVPVPNQVAINSKTIKSAVKKGLKSAKKAGVKGNKVTPFLLGQIAKETNGASLEANTALIVNNAQIAGQIANALAGEEFKTDSDRTTN